MPKLIFNGMVCKKRSKFFHNLLTLMLFTTRMTYFLLGNTKGFSATNGSHFLVRSLQSYHMTSEEMINMDYIYGVLFPFFGLF